MPCRVKSRSLTHSLLVGKIFYLFIWLLVSRQDRKVSELDWSTCWHLLYCETSIRRESATNLGELLGDGKLGSLPLNLFYLVSMLFQESIFHLSPQIECCQYEYFYNQLVWQALKTCGRTWTIQHQEGSTLHKTWQGDMNHKGIAFNWQNFFPSQQLTSDMVVQFGQSWEAIESSISGNTLTNSSWTSACKVRQKWNKLIFWDAFINSNVPTFLAISISSTFS